jgi:hypothetical protein
MRMDRSENRMSLSERGNAKSGSRPDRTTLALLCWQSVKHPDWGKIAAQGQAIGPSARSRPASSPLALSRQVW